MGRVASPERRAARAPRLCAARQEDGSVSAEFAIALPAVVLMLAVLLGLATFGATQIGLEDATRGAARELARGESADTAISAARRRAGEDVVVAFSPQADGFTEVTLEKPVRILGVLAIEQRHRAQAVVRLEGR